MVTEICPGVFSIYVTLPNSPLKALNSYLIRGDQGDLLIDTGFRLPECEQALTAGLDELQVDRSSLDVLVTHLHADHSGMADLFVGPERRIYISRVDLEMMRFYRERDGFVYTDRRLLEEGFPRDVLELDSRRNPSKQMAMKKMNDKFFPLEDGDRLTVGAHTLQVILTPGHTPGHIMLWMEKEGVMFTGDNVLFDISPNITFWTGVDDSLADYLESLKKARAYPVRTALPGHRASGDYHARIDALLRHHDRRLAEVLELLREEPGLNAYDLTARMRWKIHARNWDEFPPVQKHFAVSECLAHLDYLCRRGQLDRVQKDEIWTYTVR